MKTLGTVLFVLAFVGCGGVDPDGDINLWCFDWAEAYCDDTGCSVGDRLQGMRSCVVNALYDECLENSCTGKKESCVYFPPSYDQIACSGDGSTCRCIISE